jgi:eukaryotic-like serine/threonine-protein kinase
MHRTVLVLSSLAAFVLSGCGDPDAPAASTPRLVADAPVPGWPEPSAEQKAAAERLKVPASFEEPTTGLRFLLVPGGTFRMGSPDDEAGRDEDEGPQHEVVLSPFYLSMFETTNAQYRKWKPTHVSGAQLDGDTHPAVRVNQLEAKEFCAWLSKKDQRGGDEARPIYALPTEAQWEYACRAGTTTPFAFGETLTEEQANFSGSVGATTSVGRYRPNAWGLYDMHGNVWEWCQDGYEKDYYARTDAKRKDPRNADPKAIGRLARGGGWSFPAAGVRSAFRKRTMAPTRDKAVGFRVARTVESD